MARHGINRLSPSQIHRLKVGLHADGGNLYLNVAENSRSWIFRFKLPNRPQRDMGLGSVNYVPLERARKLAQQYREQLAADVDPIDQRRLERATAMPEKPIPTFAEVAQAYITAHSASWKHIKHRQQWAYSVRNICKVIGKLPVDQIGVDHVVAAVQPWGTESAKRARQRIEMVLDYATARGDRTGDNPARPAVTLLAKTL
jgi:Arm DNA-binding domain